MGGRRDWANAELGLSTANQGPRAEVSFEVTDVLLPAPSWGGLRAPALPKPFAIEWRRARGGGGVSLLRPIVVVDGSRSGCVLACVLLSVYWLEIRCRGGRPGAESRHECGLPLQS
jgi:hypothetical protein